MAQLINDQDQLKHEVEELTVRLSGKEAEIAILKAELLTVQSGGPSSSVVQALEKENAELKAKITALQDKAIKDNDAANARLALVIQSLSHPLPSSYPVEQFPPVSIFFVWLINVLMDIQFVFNVLML